MQRKELFFPKKVYLCVTNAVDRTDGGPAQPNSDLALQPENKILRTAHLRTNKLALAFWEALIN